MKYYTFRVLFADGFYYYARRTSRSRLSPECDGYYGTPITHKDKWNTTVHCKDEIVEYATFEEMALAEISLIRPCLNDPMCLNECCGGLLSLDKITQIGKDNVRLKRGWFAIDTEEKKRIGSRSGSRCRDEGLGIFKMTPEERKELGRRNGERCKSSGTGVCGLSPSRRVEIGNKVVEEGLGVHSLTREQLQDNARKASKQKWVNTYPGFEPYVSTAAGLSHWQKARGIPTHYREKLEVK